MDKSDSTIMQTCRGWQEENLEKYFRDNGRPRVTQEREDRLIRRSAVQDPIKL